MGGALLSVLWMLAVMAVSILLFHLRPVQRRFRTLCTVFAVGAVGFTVSYLQMSPAVFGLPPNRTEPWTEFLNGFYLYSFWFFGVFVQLYSLADRGFSLTMLTDLLSEGSVIRTRQEIKAGYASGKGTAYVKHKRMAQIIHGGFIRREQDGYRDTRLGRRVGRFLLTLQQLYRFRETG